MKCRTTLQTKDWKFLKQYLKSCHFFCHFSQKLQMAKCLLQILLVAKLVIYQFSTYKCSNANAAPYQILSKLSVVKKFFYILTQFLNFNVFPIVLTYSQQQSNQRQVHVQFFCQMDHCFSLAWLRKFKLSLRIQRFSLLIGKTHLIIEILNSTMTRLSSQFD